MRVPSMAFPWTMFQLTVLHFCLRSEGCLFQGCTCDVMEKTVLCQDLQLDDVALTSSVISGMVNGTFEPSKKVQSLILTHNQLENLPAHVLTGYSPEALNISYNPLNSISPRAFDHMGNTLHDLDLSNGLLLTIHWATFRGLKQLTKLNLSNNSLGALPVGLFDGLYDLVHLDLADNLINLIHHGLFQDLHHLEVLSLAGNQIAYIDPGAFEPLHNAFSLDLGHNQLTEIPPSTFVGLDRLSHFELNDNGINEFPSTAFIFTPRLEYLNLNGNSFAKLTSSDFANLDLLRQLQVSGCQLKELTLPRTHRRLEAIDLSHNLLGTIKVPCGLTKLRNLDVSNNPIVCDCRLGWTRRKSAGGISVTGTCKGYKDITRPLTSAVGDECKEPLGC